ncbi:MAG: hypothetical protein ACKVIG_05520 [Flavobacteriales bacterium]
MINLDNQGTATIVTLINKLVNESETTIIFVSHRSVDTLQANYKYTLLPSKDGSTGKVIKEN